MNSAYARKHGHSFVVVDALDSGQPDAGAGQPSSPLCEKPWILQLDVAMILCACSLCDIVTIVLFRMHALCTVC